MGGKFAKKFSQVGCGERGDDGCFEWIIFLCKNNYLHCMCTTIVPCILLRTIVGHTKFSNLSLTM